MIDAICVFLRELVFTHKDTRAVIKPVYLTIKLAGAVKVGGGGPNTTAGH